MQDKEGLFVFAAEEEQAHTDLKTWKILTVEHEP